MKRMYSSDPSMPLQFTGTTYKWLWLCCALVACYTNSGSDDAQTAEEHSPSSKSADDERSDTTQELQNESGNELDPLSPGLAPNREEMRGMKGSKRGKGPKGRSGLPMADRPDLVPESICSGLEEKSQDDEVWASWIMENASDCLNTLTSEMESWTEKDERCGKRFIGMQLRCLKPSETPTDYENCVNEQKIQLEKLYEDKGVCIPDRSNRPESMRGNGPRGQTPSRQ